MKNIELFDYYAGVIFARLLDEFPMPYSDKMANLLRNDINLDNDSELSKHNNIIYYTLVWLRDNGLLEWINAPVAWL